MLKVYILQREVAEHVSSRCLRFEVIGNDIISIDSPVTTKVSTQLLRENSFLGKLVIDVSLSDLLMLSVPRRHLVKLHRTMMLNTTTVTLGNLSESL